MWRSGIELSVFSAAIFKMFTFQWWYMYLPSLFSTPVITVVQLAFKAGRLQRRPPTSVQTPVNILLQLCETTSLSLKNCVMSVLQDHSDCVENELHQVWVCLSVSVCLPVCLSAYLSAYLSVCLSVCQMVCQKATSFCPCPFASFLSSVCCWHATGSWR